MCDEPGEVMASADAHLESVEDTLMGDMEEVDAQLQRSAQTVEDSQMGGTGEAPEAVVLDADEGKPGAGSEGGKEGGLRAFFGAATADRQLRRADSDMAAIAPLAEVGAESPDVLSAFNLTVSALQEVPMTLLEQLPQEIAGEGSHVVLETAVLSAPAALRRADEVLPLMVASAPVLASGRAIFAQLPGKWLDVYGRSDALGTRCLFAARRHEHSVFTPLQKESFLTVPAVAQAWQPTLEVRCRTLDAAKLAAEEPWQIQLHPGQQAVRILLKPGALLARMLRRGTALPTAKFAWRLQDSSQEGPNTPRAPRRPGEMLGEFSILSNVEDAAHCQPPRFEEFPLRREQLRSLHWMVTQEQNRHEPFVTELVEGAACADAPHWKLQGRLQCEYVGIKGGVLADAIGYGKTACTIGLIDCTKSSPPPQVPALFQKFLPSRATLVLAPTNLHAQWLGEIKKFVGDTLKVLSVPTCTQLKRLSAADLMEADVVVATYRLFYSVPYLKRLEELAREQKPDFAFPKNPGGHKKGAGRAAAGDQSGSSADWASAYRTAFEALPAWAARVSVASSSRQEPSTPPRGAEQQGSPTPAKAPAAEAPSHRLRGKKAPAVKEEVREEEVATQVMEVLPLVQEDEEREEEPSAKRRRLQGKQAARECMSPSSEALYVPLEAFWWKRVVCDEFHELLSRYPPAQVAVELFHADYKWGLSGTPPCQTLAQIRKAAGFFGVQIPTSAAADVGAEAPRRVAQEWLDAFVRRNTAELPPLEEEERIVPVRQTPKERALYLALTKRTTEAGPGPGIEEPPELQAARQSASGLLKLCSHFSPSGAAEVLSAGDECDRQLALRREQVRAVERQAKSLAEKVATELELVRHFEPHFCQKPQRGCYGYIGKEPKATVAARLKYLGAATTGSKLELLARLLGPAAGGTGGPEGVAARAPEEAKAEALRVDFDASMAPFKHDEERPGPTWAGLEAAALGEEVAKAEPHAGHDGVRRVIREALEACKQRSGTKGPPQRCVRLRANLGMPRCPNPAVEKADEEGLTREEETWEWLADSDNAMKLRKVVDAWKADIERCAVQLQQLGGTLGEKLKDLRSFQETLDATQVAAVELEEPTSASFAKYGSKIEALVKHIQKLRKEEGGCKIICFVQWEDLKRKISLAFEEFGLEHVSLQGSVWARRDALMKFQYEQGGPSLLLLSLEESASGTNLTSSNHVMIVHPMEAATSEEAVAFEMQAIGRVRRPGQVKKIHVWRFVTLDTIEQEITEQHQKDLWSRQCTKILVDPSCAVVASDGEEEEEDAEAPEAAEDLGAVCETQCYSGRDEPEPTAMELSTQCYVEASA